MAPKTELRGADRSPLCSIPKEYLRKIQSGTMRYSWRGVMCNKNPFDFALYPMLLWEQKPRTIIEIGSKHGGSALWLDDVCIRFGLQTRIVSIDIQQRAKVVRKNITFLQGDGRDLGATLDEALIGQLPHPWLIVEDADHFYETTKAVLLFMAPHMRRGEYLLVEDGICDTIQYEDRYHGGPNRAVREVLSTQPELYRLDENYCDFFGYNVTWNPNGYLVRL